MLLRPRRKKEREVTLRETPASATYPSTGTRKHGKKNADVKEIINALHNAGYVIDQNALAHIANAIFRILLRDNWCQISRFGRLIQHLDKKGNYYIIFHPDDVVKYMFSARFGLLNEYVMAKDRDWREREEIELLLHEILGDQADG